MTNFGIDYQQLEYDLQDLRKLAVELAEMLEELFDAYEGGYRPIGSDQQADRIRKLLTKAKGEANGYQPS